MAKVGVAKRNLSQVVSERTIPHSKVGHAGGREYAIEDPIQRLLHTIGGGFFNEPTFYGGPADAATGLTPEAQALLDTMSAAAKANPVAFYCILCYARKELNLRQTPLMGLVMAASIPEATPYLRLYARTILSRPDEIRLAFAAYCHLRMARKNGRHTGTVPRQFALALGDCMRSLSERDILRWDSYNWPRFLDVANAISDRSGKKGVFAKPEYLDFLRNGSADTGSTPVFYARDKFNRAETVEDAMYWAGRAKVNHEVLISKFGNTAGKERLWEWLIDHDQLPYMAALRNLRRIEQAKVRPKYINKLVEQIVSMEPEKHRQMPFRFLSARDAISDPRLIEAVDLAMENSAKSLLDPLPGRTLALVDLSNSMNSPVSRDSVVTQKRAACILAALLAKLSGSSCDIYGFATGFEQLKFSKVSSVNDIARQLEQMNVGYATHAHLPVEKVTRLGEAFDRIVVFSDLCTYSDHSYGSNLPRAFADYKSKVCHPYLHSVNLSQDSQGSQADPSDPKVNLVSGYTEAVIRSIAIAEGLVPLAATVEGPQGESSLEALLQSILEKYIADREV